MSRKKFSRINLIFLIVFFVAFQIFIFKAHGASKENTSLYKTIELDIQKRISIVTQETNYAKKVKLLSVFLNDVDQVFANKAEAYGIENNNQSKKVVNDSWSYIKLDTEPLESFFINGYTDIYNCENLKYKLGLNLPKSDYPDKDWVAFTTAIGNQIATLVKNLCAARPKSL